MALSSSLVRRKAWRRRGQDQLKRQKKRERPWSESRLEAVPPLEPDASAYGEALEAKAQEVRGLLRERLAGVPLRVVASPALHHRHRVKMRFYQLDNNNDDNDETRGGCCTEVHEHGFSATPRRLAYKSLDPDARKPVAIYESLHVSGRINELMKELLEAFEADPHLRFGIGHAEFVSTDAGEGLLCLAYGRPLESNFLSEHLAPLAERMSAESVVARARRQRLRVGKDHLLQWYEVQGRNYPQVLLDTNFSQRNLYICARMLDWVVQQTSRGLPAPAGAGPDLLELYCGNGNFTLPLAANFRRVLATEKNKYLLKGVAHCAEMAGVGNVTPVRMSAEEVAEALRPGGRSFRRLREAGVDLAALSFGTVLVNPVRAGLSRVAAQIVRHAPRVIYISCNPQTLARDLARLKLHAVADAALFDQFPFTSHAEVGVRLERCR